MHLSAYLLKNVGGVLHKKYLYSAGNRNKKLSRLSANLILGQSLYLEVKSTKGSLGGDYGIFSACIDFFTCAVEIGVDNV